MIRDWKRQQTTPVQKTRILDLCEVIDVSPYTGKTHNFVLIDSKAWVNIVPITEREEIVMIRQFRHGSQQVTLEIPGGMNDPTESPSEAALRECHEETGYSAKIAHCLGELNPNPALFNNTLYTFYGFVTETTPSEYSSETEKTEVELVPIDTLKPLLLDGKIDHALVCATLWRFLYMWEREELALE